MPERGPVSQETESGSHSTSCPTRTLPCLFKKLRISAATSGLLKALVARQKPRAFLQSSQGISRMIMDQISIGKSVAGAYGRTGR